MVTGAVAVEFRDVTQRHYFYTPEIEDRGHIVLFSVCHSVIPSSSMNF